MKSLSIVDVHQRTVRSIGLDAQLVDLEAPEAIACLLRRCASYLCPCPPRTLVESVCDALRDLVQVSELREVVFETLESLVAYGDLFELETSPDGSVSRRKLLFLRPPSFVMRPSGPIFLVGISRGDIGPPVETFGEIEFCNHVRRLRPREGANVTVILKQAGLLELPQEAWLKLPNPQKPIEHLTNLDALLDGSPPSGVVEGLAILDPDTSVKFYPDRWRTVSNQTGRYIARRPQAYGADLWCYAQLRAGQVLRFLDLPIKNEYRGCDEAWRLQAAIDAIKGHPQVFRLRPESGKYAIVEFFAPLPMWARRVFDIVGEPLTVKGSLFAYKFLQTEIAAELEFIRDMLWLRPL